MNKFILLLISITTFSITNEYIEIKNNSSKEDNCTNCKAIIFDENKENPVPQSNNQIKIAPIVIKNSIKPRVIKNSIKPREIQIIVDRVLMEVHKEKLHSNKERIKVFASYKNIKNKEIKKLKEELYLANKKLLKNKKDIKVFASYKNIKKKEIKKLKEELYVVNKKLLNKQKKLKILKAKYKRISFLSKKIENKKLIMPQEEFIAEKPTILEDNLSPISFAEKPTILEDNLSPLSFVEKPTILEDNVSPISFVEIVVKDSNIFDLAIRYYGNKNEYQKIYLANCNIIGEDLKVREGMLLKIPIEDREERYENEPIILNVGY